MGAAYHSHPHRFGAAAARWGGPRPWRQPAGSTTLCVGRVGANRQPSAVRAGRRPTNRSGDAEETLPCWAERNRQSSSVTPSGIRARPISRQGADEQRRTVRSGRGRWHVLRPALLPNSDRIAPVAGLSVAGDERFEYKGLADGRLRPGDLLPRLLAPDASELVGAAVVDLPDRGASEEDLHPERPRDGLSACAGGADRHVPLRVCSRLVRRRLDGDAEAQARFCSGRGRRAGSVRA